MHEVGINAGPFRMIVERSQQICAQANEKLCATSTGIQPAKEFLAPRFGCLMKGVGV
jgi:hypothetical protein